VPGWVTVFRRVNHLGAEPGTQVYAASAIPLWVGNIWTCAQKTDRQSPCTCICMVYVYVYTSLLVRQRTILPGGPDHAVGRCNCQTWSQICRIQFSCSATNYSSLYRRSETGPSRLLAHVHGTNFHHRFVAFTLLILLNVNLRHFYTITFLIYIVRRPCCVSALTSP